MALRLEQTALAQAAATEALQILKDTNGLPRWWMSDILFTLGKISSFQKENKHVQVKYIHVEFSKQRFFIYEA